MGKVKRKHPQSGTAKSSNGKSAAKGITRRQHSRNNKVKSVPKTSPFVGKNLVKPLQSLSRPRVPFTSQDQVLLVGEGDFSFALSLVTHHDVGSIVATSYDDDPSLEEKYPHVRDNLQRLLHSRETIDNLPSSSNRPSDSEEQEGQSYTGQVKTSRDAQVTLLHSIDAKSLSKTHKKTFAKHMPFTKIVFNFPHTGGLSTDVNRQVRANQELLVAFFNSAKPLLATSSKPATSTQHELHVINNEVYSDNDDESTQQARLAELESLKVGHILVTLFEGEPYSLWNIRDLARHCGLQVIESFKFPWTAYPGYTHARTIGDIKSGKDRSDEGKRKGAWRGEERDARCYILGLQEEKFRRRGSQKKKTHTGDGEDSS